ncbi:MAG: hypothetical protein FWF03_02145, partial [Defluviitaleaceae bacterium]|nr:hypothetical protein [Defluviitaleaceae bacterium]
ANERLIKFGLSDFFLFTQIETDIAKPDVIKKIAARFNIAASSVAFVDDDAFERAQARKFIPELLVFDPAETKILRELIQSDSNRSPERIEWMRNRESRLAAEASFKGSRAEFLAECKMELDVRKAREGDIPRIAELARRARQINTSVKTKTNAITSANTAAAGADLNESALTEELRNKKAKLYVCEFNDLFGRHGIVGAALLRRIYRGDGSDGTDFLSLDLLCVSCRVEGRGVAAAFLGEILRAETSEEAASVRCVCETGSGMTAPMLLASLGFKQKHISNGAASFWLDLPHSIKGVPWIRVTNDG